MYFIYYKKLGEIRQAFKAADCDIPLVLHGGTGQTYEGFNEATRQGARKFNYASRFWTILDNHLKQDTAGAAILEEMDKVARETKDKGGRYVFADFRDRIYSEVNPDTFEAARKEMYEHVCELMNKAFLSSGKADKYQLPIE